MDEDQPKINTEKTFRIIMAVLLAAIIVLSVMFIFIYQEGDDEITQTYINKDSEEVATIINSAIAGYDEINNVTIYNFSKINLKVIDCRGLEGCSTCQFKKGHLPGAELNDNYLTLYNITSDILVYSKNGTVGARFCENLTGHVNGNIYNLIGGYEAWVAAGYPVETGL